MNEDKNIVPINIDALKDLIDEDAERYNNQYNRLLKQNRSLQKELKELKAENERLKEKVEKLDKMTGIFSARLCQKYQQTLQEIRDMAGSIIGNANATYTDFYNKLSDILDKINEVIGAEE